MYKILDIFFGDLGSKYAIYAPVFWWKFVMLIVKAFLYFAYNNYINQFIINYIIWMKVVSTIWVILTIFSKKFRIQPHPHGYGTHLH